MVPAVAVCDKLRQDPAHTHWEQVSLCCLYDSQKPSQAHLQQAIAWRPDSARIPTYDLHSPHLQQGSSPTNPRKSLSCMQRALAPLSTVGVSGMLITSGEGILRRGHPILAVYVGDYPKQLLMTGGKHGKCPKCPIPRQEVGSATDPSQALQNLDKVLDALATLNTGPQAYTEACCQAGIKPLLHPFWENLPYTNIYFAITPNILHQLYQGVVKHLIAWLQEALGTTKIDAQCRRLPLNHSLRHFAKGISNMSRVTGKEHQDIACILLGLISGLPLPNGLSPSHLICATQAMLDFLYLSRYLTHTQHTLYLLDGALADFHANKTIFVNLGICKHWRLPKLHALEHYRPSIELYGTTDNYDTQFPKRLHIDMAKDVY